MCIRSVFSSCNIIEEEKYKVVLFEDEYYFNAIEGKLLKRIYVLDGSENIAITNSSELIFNNNIPKWLISQSGVYRKGIVPSISDIETPFEFIKHKNSNYFFVVKNNDTLKFFLSESKEDWRFIDFW